MIGQTVSHYRIMEKLGGGGMGEVYEARDYLRLRQYTMRSTPIPSILVHKRNLKDRRKLVPWSNLLQLWEQGGVPSRARRKGAEKQMRHLHFKLRLPLMFFATFLSTQTTLYGQKLSIGVTGGVALTDLMGEVISSEAKRYTFGPILEIRLPASFAIEISALYRRTGSTLEGISGISPTTIRVRANSWEFPMLVKYYVARQSAFARPYISGGYVLRYLSNAQQAVHISPPPIPNFPPPTTYNTEYQLHSNPSQGMAIGGGLSIKAGPVHIAPGIRYTGWFTVPFDVYDHGFTVQSARNQVDLLVAVTF